MKARTLELPEQLDLTTVQENLGNGWQNLADSGRKVLLAYAGFWAYVYDGARSLVAGGTKLIGSAETRGVQMENALLRRFRHLETQASDEINKLQGGLDNQVFQVRKELFEAREEVEGELERQVQTVLTNLGIPSRDRLDRLNQEIDLLNQRIDEELRKSQAGTTDSVTSVA